jgi:hypothetical protein
MLLIGKPSINGPSIPWQTVRHNHRVFWQFFGLFFWQFWYSGRFTEMCILTVFFLTTILTLLLTSTWTFIQTYVLTYRPTYFRTISLTWILTVSLTYITSRMNQLSGCRPGFEGSVNLEFYSTARVGLVLDVLDVLDVLGTLKWDHY